ncbi:N-acetylglucosamine-6-phosphate deacetylase, partial [Blyttiomyces helicus]
IAKKSAFIIDMDGVIYHGDRLLPGVPEFVDWLKRENKKFLFLTNSSDKTPALLSKKLERLGIEVDEVHFYTSALCTAQFLAKQHPNGSAFCIGEIGLITALEEVGFTITDETPDYVVIGETSRPELYNYTTIQKAVNLVRGGAKLIGTNVDVVDKVEDGFAPACGSLAAPVEAATGVKTYYLGKPNPLMMASAQQRLGSLRSETVIIGDRMDTDMIGGLEAGIDTLLVLSGVTSLEE